MNKDEALKLALEALQLWKLMQPNTLACAIRIPAITAIKAALAQPAQPKPLSDSDILDPWLNTPIKELAGKCYSSSSELSIDDLLRMFGGLK